MPLVLIFAAAGGLGAVLVLLGIIALVTALYAWLFKRRSWVGLPHAKAAKIAAGGGAALFLAGSIISGATAAPQTAAPKTPLVGSTSASISASASPTTRPSARGTSPALESCDKPGSTRKFESTLYTCGHNAAETLVWLDETAAKSIADGKAAAAKVAAEKAAAEQAATAAAEQESARQAAAATAAAEQAAIQQAAAEQAAAQQLAQQQAPPQPAPAADYVHPGSFCSGGGSTGVSKTGKAMVCAPASDGRLRWQQP